MKKGLVSIIIPAYNREALLPETLDSILVQTYKNWECIVVDDGSNDTTREVIKSYAEQDFRFKFYERPKEKIKGANACRNHGFEKSNGEFINWLDSDDLLHTDFLQLKIDELIKNESLDFCACINSTFKNNPENVIEVDRPPIMKSNNYIEDYLLNGLYFFTSAPMWRRRFLEGKNLFNEQLQRAQERDFHFRMLALNVKYSYLDKILVFKRLEEDSITFKAPTSIIAQKSVFRYFDGVFNHLKESKNNNRERLMAYVFYRQATNYYNISLLSKTIFDRMQILFVYGKDLFRYLLVSKKLLSNLPKIFVGFLMVLFFKKGYKFFHFPQYDYTKKYD